MEEVNPMRIHPLLNSFEWSRYRIVLEIEQPLTMPEYKGATLRGAFGNTFKRIACTHNYASCLAKPPECQCAYGAVFEPQKPSHLSRLRAGEEVARPFVLEPPTDPKMRYQPGETIPFGLTLFGSAIKQLVWFHVTFHHLRTIGIPAQRGKVFQREMWAINDSTQEEQCLYKYPDTLIKNVDYRLNLETLLTSVPFPRTDTLTLQWETPVNLTYQGEMARELEFHILISRLLSRIEHLGALYVDVTQVDDAWSESARQWIHQAKEVCRTREETDIKEWKRFSTRQGRDIPMTGVIGTVTYEGDLMPFIPLLILGQFTHVGKHAVFGLGKYKILIEN